jgi:hypothetical protein
MKTLFEILNKAEKLMFELGWRAGYNARMLDEKRTTRRIYPFECVPTLSSTEHVILETLLPERNRLRLALDTVVSLAVQYNAKASESYARQELEALHLEETLLKLAEREQLAL